MGSVLFLSHPEKECGVHQFGKQIFAAIEGSQRYRFSYREITSTSDALKAVDDTAPQAIIVNWHPLTLGRVGIPTFWLLGVPVIGLLHEVNERIANALTNMEFDYYIIHDPSANLSNRIVFNAGRIIPEFKLKSLPPQRPTIGSFGFATPGKGFENLVARVHAEFDDCLIRLNIPFSHFCDPHGVSARHVADRCRSIITKPGVDIEITHDFLPMDGVLSFLSENSLNAFFYQTTNDRGISSAVDLAIAAGRPVALRRAPMFRHLFMANPSIFVEERSLKDILAEGVRPIDSLRSLWNLESVRISYERMLDQVSEAANTTNRERIRYRQAERRALFLKEETARRDETIASLQAIVAKKSMEIEELRSFEIEKRAEIEELRASEAKKRAEIEDLHASGTKKDAEIGNLNSIVDAKNATIRDLCGSIAKKDAEIASVGDRGTTFPVFLRSKQILKLRRSYLKKKLKRAYHKHQDRVDDVSNQIHIEQTLRLIDQELNRIRDRKLERRARSRSCSNWDWISRFGSFMPKARGAGRTPAHDESSHLDEYSNSCDQDFFSTGPVAMPLEKGGRVIYYFVDHTILCPGNSGVQRVTRLLGRSLADVGESIRFVKWTPEQNRFVFINSVELDHLSAWSGPKICEDKRKLYRPPGDAPVIVQLNDIRAGDWLIIPEVPYITYHAQPVTLDVLMEARRLGLKVGMVFYDTTPFRRSELDKISKRHEEYMQQLLLADLIIPISKFSAQSLVAYFLIHESATERTIPEIAPIFLPGQSVNASRATEVGNCNQKIILSVGSITKHKNQITLTRAFERLCAMNEEAKNWKLVLVGDVAEDIHFEVLRATNANTNIIHLGRVTDEKLTELYQTCSFTVFPSTEEGFGLPILESLWFARPCICANYGAMAEVAEGGGCLTVDTRSVEELASAIEALTRDDVLRKDLAQQAVKRQIFTWSEYAETLGEHLNRLGDPKSKLGFIYYWIDHTTSYPSNSGIQRTARGLARSLIDQGIKLIPVKWDNQKYCFYYPARSELEYFGKWNGPSAESWNQWQEPSRERSEDWILVPELTTYLPSHNLAALREYTRRLGLRCGIIFYDAIPWKMASMYPQAAADAHAEYMSHLADFDKIFPISSHSKAELINFYARGQVRLQSFSHRFEVCELPGEFFETPRIETIKASKEPTEPIKILCVSTVEPRKNHLTLLEAFVRLKEMTTTPIELVLAGSDPYEELAKQVQAFPDGMSNVFWIRQASDGELQRLYAQCDFTVYPSIEEGYGLPIVESLWNARPCICSDQGAMAEIAKEGGCLTVNVRNVVDLANAMQQLIENEKLRLDLAREAVKRVIKTWNQYAQEIILRLAEDRASKRHVIDRGRTETCSQNEFYFQCTNLRMRPLLSICITTYNRAQWLAVSLDNLARFLPSPVDDIEILVCDNASTDHTPQVVEAFKSRSDFCYVRNKHNVGMLGNLRVTAHNARGRYIWILGDDDLVKPGAIEKVVQTIKSNPGVGLVYLNYSYSRESSPVSFQDIDKFLGEATPIVAPGPDIRAPIRELSTRSENFFTAIYCLIFRRDHALRAYSQNTDGRPFSSLPTCVPTTHYVLTQMMEELGCWIGEPAVVVNMNVSWIKYAPVWILERIPEAHDLAERMGASPAEVDHWRVHNLPGFLNFWKEILQNDEASNDVYFSPMRSITRIRHLMDYQTIAGDLEHCYNHARGASRPVANLPTSTVFPH